MGRGAASDFSQIHEKLRTRPLFPIPLTWNSPQIWCKLPRMTSPDTPLRPWRIWPIAVLTALTILCRSMPFLIPEGPAWTWMAAAFGPAICALILLVWWMAGTRAALREKLWGLGGFLAILVLTAVLLHPTMKGPGMLMLTIPMGVAAFGVGLVAVSRWLDNRRIFAALAAALLGFGFSLLLRGEGMWGTGAMDFRWRWTPSAEEEMLAKRPEKSANPAAEVQIDSSEPDWPGFRGPNRDGRQRGTRISPDWAANPPQRVWSIDIGPGWSSFAVQGGYLFTQELRGPQEFLTCYAADTGREIWASAIGPRFDDPMGGPGPRATPQLAGGRIFAQSAKGNLVCIEPSNGNVIWKADIAEISGRKPPMWGFSSSPLVVDSLVVAYVGGIEDQGVLAFESETGSLEWFVGSGNHSYSSPQFSTLAGEPFVLMLTNRGLIFIDPAQGEVRLKYRWTHNEYRALQPQLVGSDSVLLATGVGKGTRRIRIAKSGDGLQAEEVWTNAKFKPDFNDFVIHEGHLYGFDGSFFACIDLETGERVWKGGRYGKGQVLLLADCALLLVISEQGEGVLVRPTPEAHEEVARTQILDGKSWSHPVVVGNRLFVRNSQQAVCFELSALP